MQFKWTWDLLERKKSLGKEKIKYPIAAIFPRNIILYSDFIQGWIFIQMNRVVFLKIVDKTYTTYPFVTHYGVIQLIYMPFYKEAGFGPQFYARKSLTLWKNKHLILRLVPCKKGILSYCAFLNEDLKDTFSCTPLYTIFLKIPMYSLCPLQKKM